MKAQLIPFHSAYGKLIGLKKALSFLLATLSLILIMAAPYPALASGWSTDNQGWVVSKTTWKSVSEFVKLNQHKAGLETSILNIVGKAEAPVKGYDSVVLSARIRPEKSPSKMTLAEIQFWVRSSPKQNHAIGRYQFIPKTFNRLVRILKLSPKTIFSSNIQDLMARRLIKEAGVNLYRSNKITADRFMDNLAKIWAGLPLKSGKSAYHNIAGNRATVKRASVKAAVTGDALETPAQLTLKSNVGWSNQNGGWKRIKTD